MENIDCGDNWECMTTVDIGKGQEGHSCVGDSGKAWVLWEVVGSQGMCVQNAQLGYIFGKSLNRQWFENFFGVQEEWGRH